MPPGLPEFIMGSYYYQRCCNLLQMHRPTQRGSCWSQELCQKNQLNSWQKSRLMEPSSGLGTELVILIRGISLWLTRLIVIKWITAKLLLLLRDQISNVDSPRRTCPNSLLYWILITVMPWECVFVKNRFFHDFFPQIVAFATAEFLGLSTKSIMPAQVPKTQELGRFAASFRRLRSKVFSFKGASPPSPPPRALPLDTAGGSTPRSPL